MIAVDTNILVYSHRGDSAFHKKSLHHIKQLAESGKDWAIPWPCIYEFLAIVTHPNIYKPPTPLDDALVQVDCWFESPTLYLIGETSRSGFEIFKSLVTKGKITGALIHDAKIASICLEHNIEKLWTSDRDYSRFPGLKIENPLLR